MWAALFDKVCNSASSERSSQGPSLEETPTLCGDDRHGTKGTADTLWLLLTQRPLS